MPKPENPNGRVITSRIVEVMNELIASRKVKNQNIFADIIGVKPPVVSRWVKQKSWATLDDVVTLCVKLKVSPMWIILGTGEMFLNKTTGKQLERQMADLNTRLAELEVEVHTLSKRKDVRIHASKPAAVVSRTP